MLKEAGILFLKSNVQVKWTCVIEDTICSEWHACDKTDTPFESACGVFVDKKPIDASFSCSCEFLDMRLEIVKDKCDQLTYGPEKTVKKGKIITGLFASDRTNVGLLISAGAWKGKEEDS